MKLFILEAQETKEDEEREIYFKLVPHKDLDNTIEVIACDEKGNKIIAGKVGCFKVDPGTQKIYFDKYSSVNSEFFIT